MNAIYFRPRPVELGEATVLARPLRRCGTRGVAFGLGSFRPVLRRAALALVISGALMCWTPTVFAQYTAGGGTSTGGNGAIAIGGNAPGAPAVANAGFATAVGNGAWANGTNSSALGSGARATAEGALAVGNDAIASGGLTALSVRRADGLDNLNPSTQYASVAIGRGAQATASAAQAFGAGALATGVSSTAFGVGSRAEGASSIAMGPGSRAIGDSSMTMGRGSVAQGMYGTAFGNVATARGTGSTAIGHSADAIGTRSIALGTSPNASAATASQMQDTTTNTRAGGTDAIAVGTSAVTGADNAIALGTGALVNSAATGSMALGAATSIAANATGAVALGRQSSVTGASGLAAGQSATAGTQAVALGFTSSATATSAVAIGDRSVSNGGAAVALGYQANTGTSTFSVAIGGNAATGANNAVAIGSGATSNFANSVALGAGSVTAAPTGVGWATGTATPGSTVSVGSTTLNRRITNLADGAADTDAVTIRQLRTAGDNLAVALGGGADFNDATGAFVAPSYTIGGQAYANVGAALAAQDAIVTQQGNTSAQALGDTAGALGGGATYDPATGTISMPVYVVDDGSGTATTEVTGVGGAVDNLDTRITAMQVGEAGLVQQVGPAGAADPSAGITVGAGTGGDTVSFANDTGAARRLVGVANATDANDAVNLSQLQSAIAAVEFAEGVYFQVNPGPDPDNPAGGAVAGGNLSTASGPEVVVSGDYGFGAGYLATVENDAESGVAIGHGARAGSDAAADPTAPDAAVGAVAIGRNAHAGHAASVALGAESATSRGAQAGYAAFGLADPQSSVGEVAVGAAGSERQITHVAAGSEATDAVNVAQLQGASEALGSSLAAGLGGGAAYDPATGTVSTPEYEVDDGSGTAPTLVSGVGGAVSNLDARIVAIQTGAAGMLQQLGTGGTVDPAATITLGGNTGGTVLDIRNQDGGLRRISGVLNPLEAEDAVNMGWVNARLESFEVSGLHFFHANPDGVDPDANDSVAIGSHAIAIGPNTIVNADFGVGMGDAVSIATLATDGVGIGRQATLTENAAGSMALGADTTVDHADSVALGRGSATGVGAQTDYAAFGLAAPQSSAGEVSIGTAGVQRQITNLAAGSGDYDAVNVLQLRGATQTLGQSIADAFGGTAAYDPDTGIVTLPTYEIEGEQVVGVDGAINNLFSRTETNENDIAALAAPETGRVSIAEANIQGLIDGQLGLVQQSDLSPIEPITVGAGRGGNVVDFTNANAIERRLTGVAVGAVGADSVDAVSGAQLYATRQDMAQAYGGGATVGADGTFTGPTYLLSSGSYSTVGDALVAQDTVVSIQGNSTAAALGGGSTYDASTGAVSAPTYTVGGTPVTGVEGAITNIDGRTTSLEEGLAEGTVGLVQ